MVMDTRETETRRNKRPRFDLIVGSTGVADYLQAKRESLEGIRVRRLERFVRQNGKVALSLEADKNLQEL